MDDKDSPIYIGYIWASCIFLIELFKAFIITFNMYFKNSGSASSMNILNCGKLK